MKEEPGQQLSKEETSKRDDRYQNSAPAPDDHMAIWLAYHSLKQLACVRLF
jgi:hypothetical protein